MRSGTRIENTRPTSKQSVIPQQTLTRGITRLAGNRRVSGTTISFASNTISDSGSGLAAFAVNDVIEVRGSASNDGEYFVTSVAAGALGVHPALTTESAGATVELRRK